MPSQAVIDVCYKAEKRLPEHVRVSPLGKCLRAKSTALMQPCGSLNLSELLTAIVQQMMLQGARVPRDARLRVVHRDDDRGACHLLQRHL